MNEKNQIRTDLASQSVFAFGNSALGFAVPATVLAVSDVEAQTAGMERRDERRTGRQDRRDTRQTGTMSENAPGITTRRRSGRRPSLSTRVETVRYFNEIKSSSGVRQTTPIEYIADALVAAGYTSLDKQAKALGIHRATAWTIIKKKHKLGRLNPDTVNRMLANRELPASVRIVIEQYLAEWFDALPKSLTRALADIE